MRPEFTHSYYRDMIRALKADRRMIFYDEPFDLDGPERLGLLRHDIDICLHAAAAVAEIEHEEGVKATYFLRLNGTFYNPFSTRGAPLVRRIIALGHRIGLHFDTELYRATGVTDRQGVRAELAALSDAFGVEVRTFSQHRPFSLGQSDIADDPELAEGFAYNDVFFKQMKYISDSGQSWREGDAFQHVDAARHLHVLTHPIWWTADGLDWPDCLRTVAGRESAVILDKAEALVARYGDYLKRRAAGA